MKNKIAVMTGIMALTISGLSLAEMPQKGDGMVKDKTEMMEGKGGMMGMMGGKGMMGMCQGMMNKPSMVAVGDGVVVLSGKKLYKYDANLNLVKEADIKMEDMGMMGKGMGSDEKTPAATAEADEHAAHHPEKQL